VTLSTLGASGQGQGPLATCCKPDTDLRVAYKMEDVCYLPIYLGV